MGKHQELSNFTVKVDSGSGCLFQPATHEYSYVLTAAHVLTKNKLPKIFRQTLNTNGDLVTEKLEIMGKPYIHHDKNKDAAIIKVKPVAGIQSLIRADLTDGNKGPYFICGHPFTRSDMDYSFRSNSLSIKNRQLYGYIEAELTVKATWDEINGQSGGGIIRTEDSCCLLAGIQKQMTVADKKELLGSVNFMPLSFFDEIIEKNNAELSPLFPPYIQTLSHLLADIFQLKGMPGAKAKVRGELEAIAKKICGDILPGAVIDGYGDSLLVNGTDRSMIGHKQLWIAFLEMLSYSQLHYSGKLTLADLPEIYKKRKLYFADTDEWITKLEDVYKTDLSAIEKGGCVVIATTGDNAPATLEVNPQFTGDISKPPITEMNISNTVKDPVQDLRIVHIFKFQHNLITNAFLYTQIAAAQLKDKMIDETKDII